MYCKLTADLNNFLANENNDISVNEADQIIASSVRPLKNKYSRE